MVRRSFIHIVQMVMVCIDRHTFASSAIFISMLAGDVFAEINTMPILALFICTYALDTFTRGIACTGLVAAVFALFYTGTSASVFIAR